MAASDETAILDEISEDFLSCSICLEQYNSPKVLECMHTFCEQCLTNLVEKKGFLRCPVCNKQYQLPDGGVADLKSNFFMNDLLALCERRKAGSMKAPTICEGCEEITASHRCVDCPQYCCDNCVKVHRRIPATKSHRILLIEEYEGAKTTMPMSVQPTERCSVHSKNELQFYCDTCQVAICSDCTIVDHRVPSHSHRYLQQVADQCRGELKAMVQKLKVKETEAEKNKAFSKKVDNELQQRYQAEVKKVNLKAEGLVNKIRQEEKKIVDELKREYDSQLKSSAVVLDDLELKHGNIKSTCSYLETLIQHGSNVQIISTKDQAIGRIKELVNIETQPHVQQGTVTFQPYAESKDSVGLGKLMKLSSVCASQCTVENIPKQLEKGNAVDLVITTRDTSGRQIVPQQIVKVKVRKPDGSWEDITVMDKKNGTIVATVCGEMDGRYQVSVTVGDEPIAGTPAVFQVIRGLVKTIGNRGKDDGQFENPSNVTINKHGHVVTADKGNNRVVITGSDGKLKKTIKFKGTTQSITPCDVAVSSNDTYYTLDDRNRQVVISDENGGVIKCFGEKELKYPHSIAVSPVNGTVYVTDWDGNCVRMYDKDGKYMKSFGSKGKGHGQFNGPQCIAVGKRGTVYVADFGNNKIQIFSADGQYLKCFGTAGEEDGKLNFPMGVAASSSGYVFVSDRHRVQKFGSDGRFICRVDSTSDKLKYPVALAVSDTMPNKVVVADSGNDCVKVFLH